MTLQSAQTTASSLLNLPSELLTEICLHLNSTRDLGALAQSSRWFYHETYQMLYQHGRDNGNMAVRWALLNNDPDTFQRAREFGILVSLEDNLPLLHLAVQEGQEYAVRLLVEVYHCDISEYDGWYKTPLIHAVKNNHLSIATRLLSYGANPSQSWRTHYVYDEGEKPLHVAARLGYLELARLLIAAGADVLKMYRGETVLHAATAGGHAKVVELLLNSGTEQLYWSEDSQYRLCYSAVHSDRTAGKNANTLRVFLERVTTVSSWNTAGHKFLFHAVGTRDVPLTSLLLEYGLSPQGKLHKQPLHRAAANGYTEIVELLMNYGAKIDALDKKGKTALFRAVINNQHDSAKVLLEAGADVTIQAPDGDQLLHAASCHDMPGIVNAILERGANPAPKNLNRWTPLLKAANHGWAATTKLLLQHGADVGQTFHSWTALSMASTRPTADTVSVLISYGADAHAISWDGVTALHIAAGRGRVDTMRLLLEQGVNVNALTLRNETPVMLAVRKGHQDAVSHLVEIGANIELATVHGQTPVLTAAHFGYLNILQVLVGIDANLGGRDSGGFGAFTLACRMGHIDILRLLWETGKMDINEQSVDGRTPLLHAAMRGQLAVVKYLISREPRPLLDVQDKYGASALTMAVRNGHCDIVKYLLEFQEVSTDRVDMFGHNLTHWAARCDNPKVGELLELHAARRGSELPPDDALTDGQTETYGEMIFGDIFAAGDIEQTKFIDEGCFCVLCGRCATAWPRQNAYECKDCSYGIGYNFVFCESCSEEYPKCLDANHELSLHECECKRIADPSAITWMCCGQERDESDYETTVTWACDGKHCGEKAIESEQDSLDTADSTAESSVEFMPATCCSQAAHPPTP